MIITNLMPLERFDHLPLVPVDDAVDHLKLASNLLLRFFQPCYDFFCKNCHNVKTLLCPCISIHLIFRPQPMMLCAMLHSVRRQRRAVFLIILLVKDDTVDNDVFLNASVDHVPYAI